MLKQHRPPTKAQLQRIVDEFNRDFPIGTVVLLRMDSREVGARVASAGMILSGHSAVAGFEGVSGLYSIEDGRVRAVPSQ